MSRELCVAVFDIIPVNY